jgi:hypothetical protein
MHLREKSFFQTSNSLVPKNKYVNAVAVSAVMTPGPMRMSPEVTIRFGIGIQSERGPF